MLITIFLCGDAMIGRGIDQILAYPGDPELKGALEERGKLRDSSCATLGESDKKGDAVGDSLEMLRTAAEFLIGPTSSNLP